MHVFFTQFAFIKFIMTNSSKSSLVRFYSTTRNIKSSPKNHYNILNITPHATQSEVKSAYYKLSLQYHPDKNKSEYAKQKFQDISDAYEILSNHKLRKDYDRNIMIRQQPISNVNQSISFRSQYKDKVYSDTSKIYNFDAWTQAHYAREFQAARMRRKIYEDNKLRERLYQRQNQSSYFEISLFLVFITLTAFFFQERIDVPISDIKKTTEKNKKNID